MTPDWPAIILTALLLGVIPLAGLIYFLWDGLRGHKIPSGDDLK